MKTKFFGLLLGITLGLILFLATHSLVSAAPVMGVQIPAFTRNNAVSYARTAQFEPYNLGGNWWINDDNQSTGEGVDCSRLVFKSWAMKDTVGVWSEYWSWQTDERVSGPYTASDFYVGCSGPTGACTTICGSNSTSCGNSHTLLGGDAFVGLDDSSALSSDHIVIFTGKGTTGYDWVIDSNLYHNGTGYLEWRENQRGLYRINTYIKGIERKPW